MTRERLFVGTLLCGWIATALAVAAASFLWFNIVRLEQAGNTLARAIVQVERSVGYSGFIHHFKNMVLRPEEPRYHALAMRSYDTMIRALGELEAAGARAAVDMDLTPFRSAMSAYRDHIEVVRAAQAAGHSPAEVDARVRTADGDAAESLEELEQHLAGVLRQRERLLSAGLVGALACFVVGLLGVAGSLRVLRRMRLLDGLRRQALLEQEKRHSAKLATLVDKLAEANGEQVEFTYSLSHDLMAPTNTASMIVSILGEEIGPDLEPEHREMLDDLHAVVLRMRALIDGVLDYSRSIEGEAVADRVDLQALLEEVMTDLAAEIAERGASIGVEALPAVLGHRSQLRQLLQNLLSNAIKFHKQGESPVVRIHAERAEGGRVAVTVSDRGIGIPEDQRERIFSLFGRLHTRADFAGSGLGLAISRRIARRHGGDIAFESDAETGSRFTVTLLAA